MATLYATKGKICNKGDYAGEYVIHTSYSSNTTVSAGDVCVLARIPFGVKITDVVLLPGVAAGTTAVSKIGTSASPDLFITSAIHTAATKYAIADSALFYRFSASDGVAVRYDEIRAAGLTVFSAGRWFDVRITYVEDDDPQPG